MSSAQVQNHFPSTVEVLKYTTGSGGVFLLFVFPGSLITKAGLSFTMKSKSAGIAGVSHPSLAKHVFQVFIDVSFKYNKTHHWNFFSRTPCVFLVPTDPLQLEL